MNQDSGYGLSTALLASMGTGILNWVFALPAVFTIDTWGRRNLLLFTFPFLAIFLFWSGFSFWIEEGIKDSKKRVAMVTTGMYLFEVFYSPGEGPVPFTYSAEAFPLHVREVGMSWATATTWCFNFILSFTWPHLLTTFKPQGAFGWYAAWCLIGWVLVLLFVPETKGECLDFSWLIRLMNYTNLTSFQPLPWKSWIKSSPSPQGSMPLTSSRMLPGTSVFGFFARSWSLSPSFTRVQST